MLPYTVLMPKQVMAAESPSDATTLSLLVANVLMSNRASDALVAIVRHYDPDVILTVETDRWASACSKRTTRTNALPTACSYTADWR